MLAVAMAAAIPSIVEVPVAAQTAASSGSPHRWNVIDEGDYQKTTYVTSELAPQGGWQVDQGDGDVGGSHATATGFTSTVVVEFRGTRAKVIAPTGPDGGQADVFVDYHRVGTIDQYSAESTAGQVVFDTGRLRAADHTVSLVATGEKNPSSLGANVRFDAVSYAPLSEHIPSCKRQPRHGVRVVTAPPYSAAGDGMTSDREVIQRALDDAGAAGGGTVVLPTGCTFLSGSLTLPSNTTLTIDGTLLQSQEDAHYGYTPLHGHNIDLSIDWDHAGFHNLPLVFAGEAQDVAVTGHGKIELTQPPIGQRPIELWPIGFSQVSGFEVRDVTVLNGDQFGISAFNSDNGLIADTEVLPIPAGLNTNGLTIENSQHIRVTGNRMITADDAVQLSSSFEDPRSHQAHPSHPRWWSTDIPEPVRDIEFEDNEIINNGNPYCSCPFGKAIAIVLWGGGAPDVRDVQMSEIDIHDNKLTGQEAIGCWCVNWYLPPAERVQSPLTDVRFEDNELNGTTAFTWAETIVTDLQNDFGALGTRHVQNGGFENTGTAWWGQKGDAGATDAAGSSVLRSPQARAALEALDPDGWVGYVQPRRGHNSASLYEGLGLADSIPGVPFGQGAYELQADVVTSGQPARLFAYDTCRGRELASQTVSPGEPQRVTMAFTAPRTCSDVRVGIDQRSSGTDTWALIDNMSVATVLAGAAVVDDASPTVTYAGEGDWATYPSYPPEADWGGTHTTAWAEGASATIPFTGTRAVIHALVGDNGGLADVYLDGTKMATIDYYSPTFAPNRAVFDSGPIAPGDHELVLVATGTSVPESLGTFINIDAMFVKPD